MPIFLDLRKASGETKESWQEMTGQLLGEFSIVSTGESHKDAEDVSLLSILEPGPVLPKYYLSEKACKGILRRASTRGKALPEILKEALEHQAGIS